MPTERTDFLRKLGNINPIHSAFIETFPPDDFNIFDNTVRGIELADNDVLLDENDILTSFDSNHKKYLKSIKSLILVFLGLPSHIVGAKNFASTLLRNLFGWYVNNESSKLFIALSVILTIPTAAWNLLKIIPTLMLNIIKLYVEYSPTVIIHHLNNIITDTESYLANPSMKQPYKFLNQLTLFTSHLIALGLRGLRFISRAITSPITNIRHAYHWAMSIDNETPGKVIAAAVGVAIALITIAAYTLLLPIVVHSWAVQAIPFIIKNIPVMANFMQTFLPHLTALGMAFKVSLGAIASAIPEYIGLAAVSMVALAVVDSLFKVKDWFFHKLSLSQANVVSKDAAADAVLISPLTPSTAKHIRKHRKNSTTVYLIDEFNASTSPEKCSVPITPPSPVRDSPIVVFADKASPSKIHNSAAALAEEARIELIRAREEEAIDRQVRFAWGTLGVGFGN